MTPRAYVASELRRLAGNQAEASRIRRLPEFSSRASLAEAAACDERANYMRELAAELDPIPREAPPPPKRKR